MNQHELYSGLYKEKVAELASLIRQCCLSQKELWQKLPYLALQAQGRGGFSDTARFLYQNGYYLLGGGNGIYSAMVDCSNGEIMSTVSDGAEPVSDFTLLKDVGFYELNVEKHIAYYLKMLEQPNSEMHCFINTDCKTPEEWRMAEAERYGVGVVYEREAV